jgi:formylglycine-generating enzyme required for sulfatase activity
MASAITLEGIDQTLSNLNYKNKNTLKCKFVQHIRQYYTGGDSVVSLNEISHEELIKMLWDTDDSFETIRKKRKNLNSVRSSVNADFKKLYDKGENPQGIKIGPNNIFVMSEDAKDKILKKLGYELQPDGTLKLDQIMDILAIANETVSGSMALESTDKKDGLKKIDQLKDLIKGLSKKVGLGSSELSDAISETGDMTRNGDQDKPGSVDLSEGSGEVEEAVEIDDEGAYLEGDDKEEILDDVETVEIDEVEVPDSDVLDEDAEIDEEFEDVVLDEEDAELNDVEEIIEDETSGGQAGDSGKEDDDGAGSGEMAEGPDEVKDVEGVAELDDETAFIAEDDQDEIIDDLEALEIDEVEVPDSDVLDEDAEIDGKLEDVVSDEEEDDLDDAETIEIDEIEDADADVLDEDAEIDEIEDTDADVLDEDAEIDAEIENIVLDEEDTELDDVEEIIEGEPSEEQAGEFGSGDGGIFENIGFGLDSEYEGTGKDNGGDEAQLIDNAVGLETGEKGNSVGIGHDMAGNAEQRIEVGEAHRGNEQLGLPVDSLGQNYSIDEDSKIKKNKLLAEEFDGYLGSMDRYYNHYLLIPGGEYIIGSRKPKKDEKPEKTVYLEPFYIGRFPVTNGLFEIFVEKTGYKTTAEKVGYGTVYYGRFEKRKDAITGLATSIWNSSLYCKTVEGACWYQPTGPKSTLFNKRNHPVVQISMEDAMAFSAWTGKRLPTENEWEAASRTANGWIFPWGLEWKEDACNIEDSCAADTTPVDKYAKYENEFGIVDTLGNVLEWTNDRLDAMSIENHGENYRAVKGGSWISGNNIKLFRRFMMSPESHSNILGFRCVA